MPTLAAWIDTLSPEQIAKEIDKASAENSVRKCHRRPLAQQDYSFPLLGLFRHYSRIYQKPRSLLTRQKNALYRAISVNKKPRI